MLAIIEFLSNPYTQALFWLSCVAFSIYFAHVVKRMSFGADTGTKSWTIIAFALFLIGLRVSFKVIFPSYSTSYALQMLRFSIGIVGVILLFYGFSVYCSTLRRMLGVRS